MYSLIISAGRSPVVRVDSDVKRDGAWGNAFLDREYGGSPFGKASDREPEPFGRSRRDWFK